MPCRPMYSIGPFKESRVRTAQVAALLIAAICFAEGMLPSRDLRRYSGTAYSVSTCFQSMQAGPAYMIDLD